MLFIDGIVAMVSVATVNVCFGGMRYVDGKRYISVYLVGDLRK